MVPAGANTGPPHVFPHQLLKTNHFPIRDRREKGGLSHDLHGLQPLVETEDPF